MADPNLAPIGADRTLRLREAAHEYSGEKLALWFHVDVNNPRCRWNGDYWEVHMGYPVGHCAIWYLSDEDLPKLPELGEPPPVPQTILDHMKPVPILTPQEEADYLAGKYTSYGPAPAHLAHLALTPDEQAYIDAGAEQIAGAMMAAEDEATTQPGATVVHHYSGGDVGLRVGVTVEDSARSPLDERDANRPYVPLAVRDQGGHLYGAPFSDDIPVLNPDSFMLPHEGFRYGQQCPRCGKPILGGNHEVDSDDTADRRLIIRCKP